MTTLDTDGPISGTTRWVRIIPDEDGVPPVAGPSISYGGLIMNPIKTGSRLGWITYPEEFSLSPALTAYAKNANELAIEEDKLDTDSTAVTDPRTPTDHASSHDTTGSDALNILTIGGVASNDVRLTNSRTPTSHATSHDTTGSDSLNIVNIGGVASNDSRLTNSRTPTVHATSHATGGSDVITPAAIGASSTTHTHDDRYFRENEFINSSAGSADAGKPVVLDSNGKLSTSMTNTATAANTNTSVGNFNTILSSSNTNVQSALETLDDHDHSAYLSHVNSTTVHFTQTEINHTNLLNRGSNTHAAIDSHLGDNSVHFAQTAVNHTNILNRGTNAHSTIDSHLGNSSIHFGVGAVSHAAITDLSYATAGHTGFAADTDTRFPSSDQKLALAGTSGVPNTSNRYVTNADTRLTNSRVPTTHASTHFTGGTDALAASNIGAEPANANIQSHISSTSNPHTVTTTQIGAIPTSQKGVANGVATLDATTKIPTSQLPDAVLGSVIYKGTWNADINVPAIPVASVSNKGWYYKVSVAGSTNIDGNTNWGIGDWVISNGVTWDEVNNTESVSSVNGSTGAISGLETVSNRVSSFNDSTENYATTNAIKTYVDTEITTHDHDGDYFTNTSFVNASADAGKPIVLDSTGKISSTMVPSQSTQSGNEITLVTTAFDGILSSSDSNVQAALETIDDHTHGIYAEASDVRFPTTDEKAALIGTDGSADGTNRYVTDSDPRMTDSRTPTAHASSHDTTGSDPIDILAFGAIDTTAFEAHTTDDSIHFSLASIDHASLDSTSLDFANSGHTGFAYYHDTRFPDVDEKDALAGSFGTPSAANTYVTTLDSRMTNSRTPATHASSHDSTGTDAITPAGIGAVDSGDLGAVDGVATLDSSGWLNISQFPEEYVNSMRYKGEWNSDTNSPTIPAASSANAGWFYVVSVDGTTLVNGINEWKVGDWIVSNGTHG